MQKRDYKLLIKYIVVWGICAVIIFLPFSQEDIIGLSQLEKQMLLTIAIVLDEDETKNAITGWTDNSADSYMLFSIPFSSGWKAYVDGVETSVNRADNGLMAIALRGGKHSIRLKYTTPGLIVGAIVSVISLFMSFLAMRNSKKLGRV